MPKVFVYLDEYKMYSLSSQIFEGLTEEVVQYAERGRSESEQQKGPLRSGKLLADIVSDYEGWQERKFLHDYAYTLFEKRLVDDGRVLDIADALATDVARSLPTQSFVRVSGQITFNDLAAIQRTAKELNRFMAAVNYVTSSGSRDAVATLLKLQLESARGQKRSDIQRQLKGLYKPSAEQALDEQFLKELNYLLEFGFGDHFEAQIRLALVPGDSETMFTAVLDRSALRESAASIVKKYSRRSEQAFTIFGLVTQQSRVGAWQVDVKAQSSRPQMTHPEMPPSESAKVASDSSSGSDKPHHLRAALAEMAGHVMNIEDTFVGRLPNEVILDPIAVYREV